MPSGLALFFGQRQKSKPCQFSSVQLRRLVRALRQDDRRQLRKWTEATECSRYHIH